MKFFKITTEMAGGVALELGLKFENKQGPVKNYLEEYIRHGFIYKGAGNLTGVPPAAIESIESEVIDESSYQSTVNKIKL